MRKHYRKRRNWSDDEKRMICTQTRVCSEADALPSPPIVHAIIHAEINAQAEKHAPSRASGFVL